MPTEVDKNTLNELAKPFPAEAIMWKPGRGGKNLAYITARHVMNRLNSVVGVRGWWDEYEPVSHPMPGVMCKLTVVIDGEPTTKYGFGGFEEMQTPDDSFKSGESNSLRRAAVKFGIGHYLYNNGSVIFNDDEPGGEEVYGNQPANRPAQTQTQSPPPVSGGSGQTATNHVPQFTAGQMPQHGGQLFKWANDIGGKAAVDWIKDWGRPHNLDWNFKAWPEQAARDAANAYMAFKGGSVQPSPQSAQQQPSTNGPATVYGPPSDLEKPADGRSLFRLIKKIEEKYPIAFLNPVNEYGKLHHLNGRMVDWSPADVTKAWEFLGSLVAKQKENGNIPKDEHFGLGNGQPAQSSTPYDGKAKLAEIQSVVAQSLQLANIEPTDESIAEELVMLMTDYYEGKSFTLVYTDPILGEKLLETVKRDLDGRRAVAGKPC